MINYQQREVNEEWNNFPSRLRSAQATMPCVLGIGVEYLEVEDLQTFQTELGREFFNDPNSPRVLICDLRRGPRATAFLRLLRRSGGKPPYTLVSSDPESFECIVRRTRPMFLSLILL
jgi:hypothetical protein